LSTTPISRARTSGCGDTGVDAIVTSIGDLVPEASPQTLRLCGPPSDARRLPLPGVRPEGEELRSPSVAALTCW
jgi:hypothetical protein